MQILTLADDLTGALEIGAKFAACGIASLVTTEQDLTVAGAARALVIDTETRHLPAAEAGRRVLTLACAARELGVRFLYHKTDSTLRGNIGSELGALLAAWPESRLVYVPAYPRLGRTVRQGRLYVEGRPVDQTAFACDPLNPVRESYIPNLLRPGCNAPVSVVRVEDVAPASAPAVYVCDAETDQEIAHAAKIVLQSEGCRLSAGPAAFAEALAAALAPGDAPPPAWPVIRTCLIVNGSRHEVSLGQTRYAEARGCTGRSGWMLLPMPDASGESGLAYAARVAGEVAKKLEEVPPDALVVFGGDTVFAILRAIGCTRLEPVGEIFPGVPLSRLPGRQLHLISKAGGFGAPDLLCGLRKRLS